MTKDLERLASIDSLTGTFNRGYFLSAAKNENQRSKRYGHHLSLLMLDIDNFKSVNDTYGHDVGDEALKSTVATILQVLRTEDTLGRFGGEEFIVLLPETSAARAEPVAQRIRQMVAEIVMETEQGPLSFTISIGIAEVRDNEEIEAILKRADSALYEAKKNGRNCVVMAR